ncbi:DUF6384 family protein [Massilia sp. MB5]|uniref:DUF6384 family protein n=1 Tax=Massilia sp. MB5 TaxID=2919578 RepID=UPI001F106072|nr:DUF6384 family protein [Massilia sp. MB5]UMR31506.1 DUF6384 family protein [Massilia sp. MB5]
MAEVKLSESLGAMALIDELRHRQMAVNELLDLPMRRQEVAAHVRQYYAAQNIAVDDALIEQGVRAFFEHRLEFDPGERGTWRRRFAESYIGSHKTSASVAQTRDKGKSAASASPKKSKSGLVQKFWSGVAVLGLYFLFHWYNGTGVFTPSTEAPAKLVLGAAPTTLAEAYRQFGVMQASPDYAQAVNMLASLRSAEDKSRLAMARLLSDGEAPAVLAIAELARQAPRAVKLSGAMQQMLTAGQRLMEMQPSPRQMMAIAELGRVAQAKAEAGESVNDELKVLQNMLVFAETAVTVRMAPTFWSKLGADGWVDGEPTEHRYFLLAEAVDEKGKPVAALAKKQKGGVLSTSAEFAVQVSEQEMKNQEGMYALSGKIANPVLGRKPAGVLAVKWEANVLPDPLLAEGVD